ncbi:phosphoenolpyruvate synthase [Noviherbaspirillum galbum]|uniref:Phosphoenolpyruvate synthase n=1 Tax=Noviherbaspirillum galbum TaxID=2709383 RepID=A0A6B3SPS0_9BURK|nr:phosphoenolpyruvate synthase [Noviherbaspirillum galbum]NEX62900.1 phosphoenolpyruvate synthase [Noviherbaspirillum galbum]
MTAQYIRWFSDLGRGDVALAGGKNASLGEMYRQLSDSGILVPNGFAITAPAYRYVLERSGAWEQVRQLMTGLDPDRLDDLARRAQSARELIYGSPLPDDLSGEIREAYARLKMQYGDAMTVAVRSSATAEDLPEASFAGQHESFLNVDGEAALLDAVRRCFASLYRERAIRYRIDHGFDHSRVLLSVGVMKMVRSDLAASGVAFSLDTESGFRNVVFITGAYGLGENVVQGTVDPDEFYVFKPSMRKGCRTVLRRTLGAKEVRMVYAAGRSGSTTRNIPTAQEDRQRFCITDDEVAGIADAVMRIESHYSEAAGHPVPMDVEWAKDGIDGKLYVVQARPETVTARRNDALLERWKLEKGAGAAVLARGRAVGTKVAQGKLRVIRHPEELASFTPGDILVADTTTPDWGTVMKSAAAIITNRGGRTCHAAIVAREMGIPAVVGCGDATSVLRTGNEATVSCAEGDIGTVYAGKLPFHVERHDLSSLPRPRTALMLNVGNPDAAFQAGMLPSDGAGLVRIEFIVAEQILAHPMALLHPDQVDDDRVRHEIMRLTQGHDSPAAYFIRLLSEGVATIAAAFHPRPVIVRMSDFKSNEYANLLGGRWFEPVEDNPMIGFRGASRYVHPRYREGFAMECAAMKRVREDMGLDNVKLMIPFCRTTGEARAVLQEMAGHGLRRGEQGLEIYVMCEIPNNVLQIDAFAELFDGFSIGSNDLTQLVLGVDRDSELVAADFDEHDPGLLAMLRMAIEGAKRNGRHVGICGQAPSDYPDIAEYLVGLGIESISLNPDSLLATMERVLECERRLGRPGRGRNDQ